MAVGEEERVCVVEAVMADGVSSMSQVEKIFVMIGAGRGPQNKQSL